METKSITSSSSSSLPISLKKNQNTIDSLSFYRRLWQTCRGETPPSHRTHQKKAVNAVYLTVACVVSALLADAGVDAHNIDEIVYVRVYLVSESTTMSVGSGRKSKHPFQAGRLWEEALVIQWFWLVGGGSDSIPLILILILIPLSLPLFLYIL